MHKYDKSDAYNKPGPLDNPEEDPLLQSLRRFYRNPYWLTKLTECLRGPSRVSLRVLDWLVTNYSKEKTVVYVCEQEPHAPFFVYNRYRDKLRGYKKADFDPFCRRERIPWVDSNGVSFQTTRGQLGFFRWALTFGVVDYCQQHAKEIEAHMVSVLAAREAEACKQGRKPKRKELSRAAIKGCTSTDMRALE